MSWRFRKKVWVDQKENVVVRAIHTAPVEEGSVMRPGSTLTFEYEKVDADTWEPVSLTMEFSMSRQAVFKPTGRTVYTMNNFHKFDVQSTITVVGPEKVTRVKQRTKRLRPQLVLENRLQSLRHAKLAIRFTREKIRDEKGTILRHFPGWNVGRPGVFQVDLQCRGGLFNTRRHHC